MNRWCTVDPSRVGKYWQSIRRYVTERGASLVFATHSPRAVLAEAQRVICLREGRVLYNGEVEGLYWNAATPELAECLGEANWLEPEAARLWLRREEAAARCFRPEQISVQADEQSPIVVESSRFSRLRWRRWRCGMKRLGRCGRFITGPR